MILLTDISFFVGDLEIVNTDTEAVANNLQLFISKREPEILREVLGYELYKALQTGLLSDPVATVWQDLIFGKEYTNNISRLSKWRGLIDTDSDYYSFGAGVATYKAPQWVQVGVTTDTLGNVIIANYASSFIATDWIGWEPLIYRKGAGFLKKDVHFSYNILTGAVALLQTGEWFEPLEELTIQFQIAQNTGLISSTFTYKQSFIADYIYWHYQGARVTFTTGLGEKRPTSANAADGNPREKMVAAWNDMVSRIWELWDYLEVNKTTYTDWFGKDWTITRRYRKTNSLGI